jgi:hypothetical protein
MIARMHGETFKSHPSLNDPPPPPFMNEQKIPEVEEISDFHSDFMRRYVECELKRQELVSEQFLRERSNTRDASMGRKAVKTRLRAS